MCSAFIIMLWQALFRTNHGYDPIIRQHYEWSQVREHHQNTVSLLIKRVI